MFRRSFLTWALALALVLGCLSAAEAITKTDLCASLGAYSDTIVRNRDSGILLTQSMAIIDEHERKDPKQKSLMAFARWIVLHVHKYNTFDAARMRQLVEIECFERF